jgi:hypothetical protein
MQSKRCQCFLQIVTGHGLEDKDPLMDLIDEALVCQHTSDLTGLQKFQDLCQVVVVLVGSCMYKVFRRKYFR